MNKTIELKATGETITFTKSTADFSEMIVTLPASGEGPPAHRHVLQTETFEAIDGKLGIECGKEKIVLEPGQSFTIPKNTSHRCYAVDGTSIKFRATFTPALNIEYFLTEIFDGCNRKNAKAPSVFDASYILRQVKGEYYLVDPPQFIQQTLFPVISFFGKLFGLVRAKPKSA